MLFATVLINCSVCDLLTSPLPIKSPILSLPLPLFFFPSTPLSPEGRQPRQQHADPSAPMKKRTTIRQHDNLTTTREPDDNTTTRRQHDNPTTTRQPDDNTTELTRQLRRR
ncbi:hypothetical protein N7493_010466 [Penicillium malachiteum]|uniref:Uncharacterized protein n=1 Tax=Penicillium malachiteum TaxID=1324776 RepID=A0AAD6MRH9_9EURO|nr:hypothetical protein N7493_010466 [Penicillium malachiteum]